MVSPIISSAIARKGTKETGKFLQEKLGYNFLDLVTKLLLFYSISFIISKYMEVVSSTPTAPGKFNPEGWDRPYDYGSIEHQQTEPHLFPQKNTKLKFWDFVNAIAVFYIGWEAYKYYSYGGRDFLTLGIFALIISVLSVLSFSKFIGKFGFNKFQEENK